MIRHAFTPGPALGRGADRPRPRRALACTWVRRPATGALSCRRGVAAPEFALVAGPLAGGVRPPAPLSRAA